MEESIIKFIAKKLSPHKNLIDSFSGRIDCPRLSNDEKKKIQSCESDAEKQFVLKEIIASHLKGNFNDSDINRWIVHKWGGIGSFKIAENDNRITSFKESLSNGNVNLENISSLSKIASFANPQEYFIFDSRVAYSLNALLLQYSEEKHSDCTFFYMPQSRNYREIIMSEIIREKTKGKVQIYEQSQTYLEYCNIIKSLYLILFQNETKARPFKAEILLFLFADEVEKMFDISKRREIIKRFTSPLTKENDKKKETTKENIWKSKSKTIKKKTETPNHPQLSSLIEDNLPSLRENYGDVLNTNPRQIKGGPKPMLTAKISNGATLALGEQKSQLFCGIYECPNGVIPDRSIFPKEVQAGYYKPFKLDQDEEALNFFKSILDQSKL